MRKIITLLVAATFAAGSAVADDKRDNPEKKAGPRDNPERKEGPRDNPERKEGPRDKPEAKEGGRRDGEKPGVAVNRELQKEARIFVAYDKDRSGTVTEDEMAAMREGKLDSGQKRQMREEIKKADRNDDGVLDLAEWHVLMSNRRASRAREGDARRGGDRDRKRDQPERR
ncbi:MAG: EF-hand domain-containing protein [Verrucomicrobiales bacterium]